MGIVDKAVNLVFPRRCPVCDDITMPFGRLVCDTCKGKIKYITDPACLKCGKQIQEEEKEFCRDCAGKEHFYIRGRALYEYHSMSDSISRFKYAGRREYATFYGQDMTEKLGEQILQWKPQALIPVPIHVTRRRVRGYNQSELLAGALSAGLQIPMKADLIRRSRKTVPQKELNPAERQNNLKRAFKICGNDVKLNTIVIVDDIYTTGSTIDAMAQTLKKAGVTNVYYVALSIGNGL